MAANDHLSEDQFRSQFGIGRPGSAPAPKLTDDDYYSCGHLLGVSPSISSCATGGCRVCQAKQQGSIPKNQGDVD